MAHGSGLITAPARLVEDVRSVLGFSPRSDGKYYLEDACLSSAINIWAKYKPVRLQTWDTSSQWDYSNNRWKSSANWFHGMGNRIFGLTAYYNSNLEYVINAYDGGMNGWTYDRPNGYYRLSDFAQYDHYAQAPVSGFACTSEMQNGGTFNAQISRIAYSSSDNNVHIEDFVSGGSYLYFGVAIVNSSGGIVKRFTASSPSGCDISTTLTGISDGNYRVYPFLSLYYISPSSTDISANTYYSIPLVDYANMRIGTTSAGSIEASCGSGTIVSWKIYLNRASVPSSSTIYLYTTGGSLVDYWTLSSSSWSASDDTNKGRYMAVSGSTRTFVISGSPENYYLQWTGGGDTIRGTISYDIGPTPSTPGVYITDFQVWRKSTDERLYYRFTAKNLCCSRAVYGEWVIEYFDSTSATTPYDHSNLRKTDTRIAYDSTGQTTGSDLCDDGAGHTYSSSKCKMAVLWLRMESDDGTDVSVEVSDTNITNYEP